MSRPFRAAGPALGAALLLAGAAPLSADQAGSGAEKGAGAEIPADVAQGVEFAVTKRVSAVILTVDRETRQILMRNLETGEVFVHRPPREMTGLMQVESGDEVEAVFTRGVTARPAEPGDRRGRTETEEVSVPAVAEDGSGFIGGELTRAVATLEAWNTVTEVAVLRMPEGRLDRYHVENAEAQAFLASLSPGDAIEVEFSKTVLVIRRDR